MNRCNENIGVEAGFWARRVIPLRFVWNGRRHDVKRVTMDFERRDGNKKYRCFSVETSGLIAELLFDVEELTWRLGAVEAV